MNGKNHGARQAKHHEGLVQLEQGETHAVARRRSRVTPAYPLRNLFFLNLKFASGVIAQVKGLYDVVEPPLPMMQLALYGAGGTAVAEFTDNKPGRLQVVR